MRVVLLGGGAAVSLQEPGLLAHGLQANMLCPPASPLCRASAATMLCSLPIPHPLALHLQVPPLRQLRLFADLVDTLGSTEDGFAALTNAFAHAAEGAAAPHTSLRAVGGVGRKGREGAYVDVETAMQLLDGCGREGTLVTNRGMLRFAAWFNSCLTISLFGKCVCVCVCRWLYFQYPLVQAPEPCPILASSVVPSPPILRTYLAARTH